MDLRDRRKITYQPLAVPTGNGSYLKFWACLMSVHLKFVNAHHLSWNLALTSFLAFFFSVGSLNTSLFTTCLSMLTSTEYLRMNSNTSEHKTIKNLEGKKTKTKI